MKQWMHLAALAALTSFTVHADDTVRLGNLQFAHYCAVSYMKDVCPKYGIHIEERMFAKGLDIVPAMMAGDIDVSASAMEAAISGRAAGVPNYIVAGFANGGANIISRADLKLKTIADLKGKRVGLPRGGPQEILLLAELTKAHLSWSEKGDKDVTIVYMGYPDLNQALQTKNLDAISQSEPYAAQAINKGFATEIIKPYDTELGRPIRALVMTEKLYNNRALAARVVKCFVDSTKQFLADPKFAEKYVRDTMFKGQVSAEDYRDAMDNVSFSYDIDAAHVQHTTDYMKQFGIGKLQNPPAAKDWVKTDLLDAAKKDLGVK